MHKSKLSHGLLISTGLIFLGLTLIACQNNPQNAGLIPVPDIVRWSAPDTDNVQLLSTEPNECLAAYDTAEAAQLIAFGRLAFRSPFLLGGQAARKGLTCQACHGQGQTNTHFFVTGLSDKAGTADVTSFHFSDELGDEFFNPVPIPSLSDNIEGIDFDPLKDDLDIFVTRLITKEFTGPQPSDDIQSALLSYLRALDDQHCLSSSLSGQKLLQHKADSITDGFSALMTGAPSQDTLDFMTAALRQELGRLHERFPNQKSLQDDLADISQSLNMKGGHIKLEAIKISADKWEMARLQLSKNYAQSLFNPKAIKKWDDARRKH